MDPLRVENAPLAERRALSGITRCAICRRWMGAQRFYLAESGEAPEPRQSWVVCAACREAVGVELQRAALLTPLRLRVAVGVVASVRSPFATPKFWHGRYWDDLTDRQMERWLMAVVILVFAVHALAFILITAVIAIH